MARKSDRPPAGATELAPGDGQPLAADKVFPSGDREWGPRGGETALEHALFLIWLARTRRTFRQAAEDTGLAEQALKNLARSWQWSVRALAWETAGRPPVLASGSPAPTSVGTLVAGHREGGGAAEPDWEARRRDIRRESYESARLLIDTARKIVVAATEPVLDEAGNVVLAAKVSLSDATKMLETADRLQRMAAGMDMETVKVDVTVTHVQTARKMIAGALENGHSPALIREQASLVGLEPDVVDAAFRELGVLEQ